MLILPRLGTRGARAAVCQVAGAGAAAHIGDMNVHAPMAQISRAAAPTRPRDYHGVNWEGLRTLYRREVLRFWKVGMQTLLAPVVTTLLYMLVFVVAMKGARPAAAV